MTELMDHFRQTGKQGGKKRAANLTAEELTAIGKKGALARWGKKAAAKRKAVPAKKAAALVRSAKAKAKREAAAGKKQR